MDTETVAALVLACCVALASVAIGVSALVGPAYAQSGAVGLEDPIYDPQGTFDVTVELQNIESGHLVVRNLDNSEGPFETTVQNGETVSVETGTIGGTNPGERIEATLYETVDEANTLDRARTRVTGFVGAFGKNSYSVPQGQTVSLTTQIKNPGTVEHTETLSLVLNNNVGTVESNEVTVGAGGSTEVTFTWDTSGWATGNYDASLVSQYDDDLLDIATISVQEATPPYFNVSIDSTNSPVLEGESLDVTSTITNTGETSDTQEITLTVEQTQVDSTTLSLGPGQSQTVTLSWTNAGPAGNYVPAVHSENESAETEVTVEEPAPPNFAVQIDSTNSPVTEGDTLDVTATISNSGDESGTQDVVLSVANRQRDSRSLTLAGGDSQQVTLSWQTSSGDAGAYTATVATNNDSAGADVRVEEPAPANFAVSIDSTTSPVTEGDTLDVTVTVTNTGDESGTKDVVLGIDGARQDLQSATLAGGDSTTLTLTWQTSSGDAGTHLAAVETADDGAETEVTVNEPSPANFAVSLDSTNSPVTEGQTVDLTATVSNTGSETGTQDLTLSIDGSQVDSTSLTLAGGESRTVTLSWGTGAGDAGTHDAVVASADDSATTAVTVEEPAGPPNFAVRITSPPGSVREGGTVEIPVTVTNTGDTGGTQPIILTIGGTQRDSTTVSLEGGASQSLTLTWQTGSGDAGGYTATVASENDSASATFEVLEPQTPANFEVAIDFTSSPVAPGENLLVGGTVRNTGEASATQTISLGIGGETVDSTRVSLAGGDSTQVTLEWSTGTGDAGEHTATLASGNDSAQTPVTVESETTATTTPTATTTTDAPGEPRFDVRIDATTAPVVGGTPLTVTATVTNRGDAPGTVDVGLVLGGETRDSRSLSLDTGASRTLNLSWQTGEGDVGEYTAVVTAGGDEAEASVAVRGPAGSTFDVDIDAVRPPDGIGDPLAVTATVTNTGEAMDTQVVTLAVDGSQRASKQLTLAGGASATIEYTWTPEGLLGDATLEVASEDDDDRSDVGAAGGGGGGNPLADPLLLGLLLLILALGGGGYYYVRRQQLQGTQ